MWRALFHLREARAAWWTEWPLEDLSAWVRGLELLCEVSGGKRSAKSDGEAPPLRTGARLLIVRLGHLGDILHTVPFARAVKRQRPDVRVEIVVGPWSEKLARRFDCFDNVIAYAPDFAQFHRGDRSGVLDRVAQREFFRGLRGRKYDAVISTSPTHLADQIILCAASAKLAVGAMGGLARVCVAGEDRRRAFDSRMREADWVCSFLPDLGLEIEPGLLTFPLDDAERKRADELLREVPKPRVVIAPGAGWPGKCWPVVRFAELAGRLREKFGAGIVIIGSRDERKLADEMNANFQNTFMNLAGETSVGESAAVIAAADLFVGNDSAPLHFAAAAGTPTLSFFGPTRASKWAPPGPQHRVLQVEGQCSGCIYWHCRAACLHDARCMKAISVDAAFAAAGELLAMRGARGSFQ